MKRQTTLTVALFVSAPACAADYLRGAPAYAPPAPVTPFTWSGFYVGTSLGSDIDATNTGHIIGNDAIRQADTLNGLRPSHGRITDSGFSGGGQIGYNYEFSPYGALSSLDSFAGFDRGGLVVGVEADIGSAGVSGTAVYTSDRSSIFNARTDYVGTARGRLGYAFGTVLVYASGGFAYAGVSNNASFLNPAGAQTYQGGGGRTATGYAIGGGIEAALPAQSLVHLPGDGAFTVRLDYLHYDLGAGSILIRNNFGLDAGYTQSFHVTGNLLRAGLNYKFNSFAPTAPVVARY